MAENEKNQIPFPHHRCLSEISRNVTNPSLVETTYRAGYTTIIVRSSFSGKKPCSDLLYNIALQRLGGQNHTGQHGPFNPLDRAL